MNGALPEGIYKAGNGLINFYAIEDGGKLTIVDTGLPGDFRRLRQWLRSTGKHVRDVDAIAMTHAHGDHIGSADRLQRASGAPAYVQADDMPFAREPRAFGYGGGVPIEGRFPFGKGIPLMLFRVVSNLVGARAVRYTPPANLVEFADGEVLDVPGRPRVVHTPGHTPGSVCLHLPERDVLFTGDALLTLNVAKYTRGAAVSPVNTDHEQARESLARIEGLEASVLLPGHGRAYFGSPAEAVAEARG